MKWPGTYYCYALFEAIFGQTIEGIHLGVLAVNVAAIVLVFFICRRLLDAFARRGGGGRLRSPLAQPGDARLRGARHAFCRAVRPGGRSLPATGLRATAAGDLFPGRRFCRLAPIMKQPGIVFTGFVLAFWAWREARVRRHEIGGKRCRGERRCSPASSRLSSSCSPLFWRRTHAERFLALDDPLRPLLWRAAQRKGVPHISWNLSLALVTGSCSGSWPDWDCWRCRSNSRTRAAAPFLLGLLLFSFIGVLPGLTFREHYFILLLPAVAFLVGAAVSVVRERLLPRFPKWAMRLRARPRADSAVGGLRDGRRVLFLDDAGAGVPPRLSGKPVHRGDRRRGLHSGPHEPGGLASRSSARNRRFISIVAGRRPPASSTCIRSWRNSRTPASSSSR